MSVEALHDYLDARQALANRDSESAAVLLERAIASPPNNPVIRRSLDLCLDHDHPAGEAILEILRVEIGRRPHDDARD